MQYFVLNFREQTVLARDGPIQMVAAR